MVLVFILVRRQRCQFMLRSILAFSGMVVGLFSSMSLVAADFQVGAVFPSLVLPRLSDGEPDSLRSFRGRKTVAHVFASW